MNPATVVSDLLLYLLGAAVMVLAGHGLLTILRVRTDTPTAIALAPVVMQAVWANVLGFGASCSIRVGALATPVWLATFALAFYGCWSFRSTRDTRLDPCDIPSGRLGFTWVAVACLVLPLVTLLPYLVYGFSEYLGSRNPDGWSYIAYGQYLWAVPRGAEGGLPPLQQYASHLAGTRHIASSELALLSVFSAPGDTQSATGLFLTLSFFSYASACAAFARTRRLSSSATILFLTVALVSGWSLNVVLANNYDNLVALTFLPGLAALARMSSSNGVFWWLLAGMIIAGSIYTYPELGGMVCAIAFVMIAQRVWVSRERGWQVKAVLSACTALALLSPYMPTIVLFLKAQVGSSLNTGLRPGEGLFHGLLAGWTFPSAFWALGGEFEAPNLQVVRTIFGFALFLILAFGILRQVLKRDLGTLATLVLSLLTASVLLVEHAYSYGAYKMIVMGWWAVAFSLIAGSTVIGQSSRLQKSLTAIALLTCLSLPTFAAVRIADEVLHAHPVRMEHFRSIRNLSRFVGDAPVGLFVENFESSEWAVYFLREHPIKVGDVEGYLNAPHVRPLLDRATPISWDHVRYVVTDAIDPGPVIESQNWTLVWQRGAYRLWDTKGCRWAVVTDASTPNGFERVNGSPFFWLGEGPTQLRLFANAAGVLQVHMEIAEGPNAKPSDPIPLRVDATSGVHMVFELHPGPNHIQLAVPAGNTEMTLTPVGVIRTLANGRDVRQAVAAVWKLATSFE